MKLFLIFIFSLFYTFLNSQISYDQKLNHYFELKEIHHHDLKHQLNFSATADEAGWFCEWFMIKKNYLSLGTGLSYKRMLPDIMHLWTPLTLEKVSVFPLNGALFSIQGRWYFNMRKFSFAGIGLYGGQVWVINRDLPYFIDENGPSDRKFHLFSLHGNRLGADILFGRKFINKWISEMSVLAGFRNDWSEYSYQCISGCSGIPTEKSNETSDKGMMHFQVFLGIPLFEN